MTNKQDSLYSDLMNDWPLIEIGEDFISFDTTPCPSPFPRVPDDTKKRAV